jgi:hypothetical protein
MRYRLTRPDPRRFGFIIDWGFRSVIPLTLTLTMLADQRKLKLLQLVFTPQEIEFLLACPRERTSLKSFRAKLRGQRR